MSGASDAQRLPGDGQARPQPARAGDAPATPPPRSADRGRRPATRPSTSSAPATWGSSTCGARSSSLDRAASSTSASPPWSTGLAPHPGIGFVVVIDDVDGPVALGADGSRRLDDGHVEGDGPAAARSGRRAGVRAARRPPPRGPRHLRQQPRSTRAPRRSPPSRASWAATAGSAAGRTALSSWSQPTCRSRPTASSAPTPCTSPCAGSCATCGHREGIAYDGAAPVRTHRALTGCRPVGRASPLVGDPGRSARSYRDHMPLVPADSSSHRRRRRRCLPRVRCRARSSSCSGSPASSRWASASRRLPGSSRRRCSPSCSRSRCCPSVDGRAATAGRVGWRSLGALVAAYADPAGHGRRPRRLPDQVRGPAPARTPRRPRTSPRTSRTACRQLGLSTSATGDALSKVDLSKLAEHCWAT